MDCSTDEFLQYIEEEDIKFIRLQFCDVYGTPKNISVMPSDIKRALTTGICINGTEIPGFDKESYSDVFLHPDPSTTALLPWRPDQGRVVRMFCDIRYQDDSAFPADTRYLLKQAVEKAKKLGIDFTFGTRIEFYLFKMDEEGEPTSIPCDKAGYMDIAPLDKCENVRREICLTLERMGITPVNSHHEAGPGQNEIDFKSADPLKAADDTITFISVVKTIAARNGLYADFSPKPIADQPGNGFHINLNCEKDGKNDIVAQAIAGILDKIYDITIFLNRCDDSYQRIGKGNAPRYISWSIENRKQLIRVPQSGGKHHYAQLRSPDAFCNPYLVFALLIHASLEGIEKNMELMAPTNFDLSDASREVLSQLKHLPRTLDEAKDAARSSSFLKEVISESLIDSYCE
ncbi:MAG: glutamine synthetase [Clostridiales bacterium]|nr:glutamine synthetase [Clostridiales bacterium]